MVTAVNLQHTHWWAHVHTYVHTGAHNSMNIIAPEVRVERGNLVILTADTESNLFSKYLEGDAKSVLTISTG